MCTLATSNLGIVQITITALVNGLSAKCRNVFFNEKIVKVPHRAQGKWICEFVARLAKGKNKLKVSKFCFVYFYLIAIFAHNAFSAVNIP